MKDFGDRTIKAISDDDFLETSYPEADASSTKFTIGGLSDQGLERVYSWLDSMTRQHPLNGSLYHAHRTLIEAVRQDVSAEMSRRNRNGTS
jgi:hypothetical protein